MSIVIVRKRGCSDDFDEFVILDFFELTFKSFKGSEAIDFEMGKELIEVFLVFGVIDLWINPIIAHLSSVSETDLVELFSEKMVSVLNVGVAVGMLFLFWFWFVSTHQL